MSDYERIVGRPLPSTVTPGSTITWCDALTGITYWFDAYGKLLREEKPVKLDDLINAPRQDPSLAELQLEAIRGVLEEVLTTSGSANPGTWGLWLLSELSRILDMTQGLEVMGVLADQEERRGKS